MMSDPCNISSRDFCLAIDSNSACIVKAFLERGGDPNVLLEGDTPIIGDFAIVRRKNFLPLHLAVVNCFRLVATDCEDTWEIALDIVNLLVASGARRDETTSFVLRQTTDLTRGGGNRVDYAPLSLALLLKKELNLMCATRVTRVRLDELMASLLPPRHQTLRVVSVPQSVANNYKKLLFSKEHSDFKFVCSDGQAFFAHKALLSVASPFFASAFAGAWQENSCDGEWKTEVPSSVIKAFLTFIYTGDAKGIYANPVQCLAIADEWSVDLLKDSVTAFLIESMARPIDSLSLDMFRSALVLAHLQGIEDLTTACFRFAKKNAAVVLTNAEIMELQTDHAGLWKELVAAITSDCGKRLHDTQYKHNSS